MADVESKSIPHVLPSSHWLKATGQCVLERYLSATMVVSKPAPFPYLNSEPFRNVELYFLYRCVKVIMHNRTAFAHHTIRSSDFVFICADTFKFQ